MSEDSTSRVMVLPVRVLTKLGEGSLDGVPLYGVASVRGWGMGLHLHYRRERKSIRESKRGGEEEMGLLVAVFEVVVF